MPRLRVETVVDDEIVDRLLDQLLDEPGRIRRSAVGPSRRLVLRVRTGEMGRDAV